MTDDELRERYAYAASLYLRADRIWAGVDQGDEIDATLLDIAAKLATCRRLLREAKGEIAALDAR